MEPGDASQLDTPLEVRSQLDRPLEVRGLREWPRAPLAKPLRMQLDRPLRLVLELRPGHIWAIECKRSLAPTPARGFHEGCKDLQPQQKLVIYPGRESFPLGQGVECVTLSEAVSRLRHASAQTSGTSRY
jgi:hypothetical protein